MNGLIKGPLIIAQPGDGFAGTGLAFLLIFGFFLAVLCTASLVGTFQGSRLLRNWYPESARLTAWLVAAVKQAAGWLWWLAFGQLAIGFWLFDPFEMWTLSFLNNWIASVGYVFAIYSTTYCLLWLAYRADDNRHLTKQSAVWITRDFVAITLPMYAVSILWRCLGF